MSSSTRSSRTAARPRPEPGPATQERPRGASVWLASFGAVGGAFGAALCCLGPLVFVTFGVGAGLASTFTPLRPLFTLLTVAALGLGFYAVYGRGAKARAAQARCAPGEACGVPRGRTRDKILLWSATLLAVVLWSFSYWSLLLL